VAGQAAEVRVAAVGRHLAARQAVRRACIRVMTGPVMREGSQAFVIVQRHLPRAYAGPHRDERALIEITAAPIRRYVCARPSHLEVRGRARKDRVHVGIDGRDDKREQEDTSSVRRAVQGDGAGAVRGTWRVGGPGGHVRTASTTTWCTDGGNWPARVRRRHRRQASSSRYR
jgi:hypothetical protein